MLKILVLIGFWTCIESRLLLNSRDVRGEKNKVHEVERDICGSKNNKTLADKGCIHSRFLGEESKRKHTLLPPSGTKSDLSVCSDHCQFTYSARHNLFLVARTERNISCYCLRSNQVDMEDVGPLVYCQEETVHSSDGTSHNTTFNGLSNNYTGTYYSMYCLTGSVLSGIHLNHFGLNLDAGTTAQPPHTTHKITNEMLIDLHADLAGLQRASSATSGLLAFVLVVVILMALYHFYWDKALQVFTIESEVSSDQVPNYGTQNKAFQPDIQDEDEENWKTSAGNSTFYQVDTEKSSLPTDGVRKEGRSKFYQQSLPDIKEPDSPMFEDD